jgi:PAS domain S-box-containing protein
MRHLLTWLFGLVVLGGLYVTILHSYLLFHSLAEMFSIVVGCAIFMLAYNARRFLDNGYILFIGIAYLFIAGVDLLHTLSYKGMMVFKGYETNLPTQLWIAARYMESVSFLLAPFFLGRRVRINTVLMSYALVTTFLLVSIFYWNIFPTCFVEGIGLTPFKIISEYIISIILMISIVIMFRRRREFNPRVLRLIVASMVLTIISEMSFTLYVHAYGLSNLIGHYLKIVSCYLIYKAIIETGLTKPYDLLYRKRIEENLVKLSRAVEQSPASVVITDVDGNIEYVNPKFVGLTGYRAEEALGRNPRILKSGKQSSAFYHNLWDTIVSGQEWRGEFYNKKKTGEFYWEAASISPIKNDEGVITHFVAVKEDITERKATEEALRNVRDDLDRRVKERTAELAAKNKELEKEIDERKRAQEALERSETELRHLSAKLLDAQEEESKRIGQELHDGLSQTLSAIKLWVEAAQIQMRQNNKIETDKALESVIPLVQTSIEEIRRVSRHLRPSVLDDLGLLPAISWVCHDFEAINSGIGIERGIGIKEDDIPEDLKIVIFRILQEALNNIAKHSHADFARISLKKNNSGLVLQVEDNGHGFDMKELLGVGNKMSGLGLRSMKERTSLSGGSFSLESRVGAGTTIRASWG